MVIGRVGSTRSGERAVPPAKRFIPANSGRWRATGSSSPSRPSSTSISAATEVSGLVIEYTRKIASGRIGRFDPRSA